MKEPKEVKLGKLLLESFFENLLLGTNHELKNRYMHVDFMDEKTSQSINFKVSKNQSGSWGGRIQHVPEARLDLPAECLKCP